MKWPCFPGACVRRKCQAGVEGRDGVLQDTQWEDIGQYVLVALNVQMPKAGDWVGLHLVPQHGFLWFLENE